MNVNKTKNDNFDMNKSKTEGTYLGIYSWDNLKKHNFYFEEHSFYFEELNVTYKRVKEPSMFLTKCFSLKYFPIHCRVLCMMYVGSAQEIVSWILILIIYLVKLAVDCIYIIRICKYYGYSIENLIGLTFSKLIDPFSFYIYY